MSAPRSLPTVIPVAGTKNVAPNNSPQNMPHDSPLGSERWLVVTWNWPSRSRRIAATASGWTWSSVARRCASSAAAAAVAASGYPIEISVDMDTSVRDEQTPTAGTGHHPRRMNGPNSPAVITQCHGVGFSTNGGAIPRSVDSVDLRLDMPVVTTSQAVDGMRRPFLRSFGRTVVGQRHGRAAWTAFHAALMHGSGINIARSQERVASECL